MHAQIDHWLYILGTMDVWYGYYGSWVKGKLPLGKGIACFMRVDYVDIYLVETR